MMRVRIRHAFERLHLDVDLELPDGLIALLGPSGSGKTRTLDVIAGLLTPDEGLVQIDDETLTDTANRLIVPPHRRRIGYVFQDSRLLPHLTVRQNLEYGRWFRAGTSGTTGTAGTSGTAGTTGTSGTGTTGTGTTGTGPKAFDALVSLLDLRHLLSRHPARLSGGEQRRVALARALLSNPRLLLLDEPLGSLEVSRRQDVLPYLDSLIAELRLPMIYVTHDWNEVRDRASVIVQIDDGHARVAVGDAEARIPPT